MYVLFKSNWSGPDWELSGSERVRGVLGDGDAVYCHFVLKSGIPGGILLLFLDWDK